VLDVEVTLLRIGAKSVTYGFEFSRRGQAVAKGSVTSVCCLVGEQHRLESTDIPASYRARLEPFLKVS
jgi:acyl-CoA thioester hydrolase